MRTLADDLLEGSIDLHAHIHPQLRLEEPGRVLDHEWARAAREAGMRGFVMKSHLWPTMGQARLLNDLFPGAGALGAIALNGNVGGYCPFAAESAVKLGARCIWMPTFSAANDIRVGAYAPRIAAALDNPAPPGRGGHDGAGLSGEGLGVHDRGGGILPEIDAIMEIARDADIIFSTGHLSAGEGLALARRAKEIGLEKFVFTHPLNKAVMASDEEMLEVAGLGYIIEHCALGMFPLWQSLRPQRIAAAIRLLGAGRCILTTDAQMDFNPPPPEMLRMFIATLLQLGIGAEEIDRMARRNPARLANLEG